MMSSQNSTLHQYVDERELDKEDNVREVHQYVDERELDKEDNVMEDVQNAESVPPTLSETNQPEQVDRAARKLDEIPDDDSLVDL